MVHNKKTYKKKKLASRNNCDGEEAERGSGQGYVVAEFNLLDTEWFRYYKTQDGIHFGENDFLSLIETIKKPLPACLRINPFSPGASLLHDMCENSVIYLDPMEPMENIIESDDPFNTKESISTKESIGQIIRSEPLKWFSDNPQNSLLVSNNLRCDSNSIPGNYHLAWKWSDLDRKSIKKDDRLKNLKTRLYAAEIRGCISRQESVSMIPVLLIGLDNPDLRILDMCAAPGSKTSQIVDHMRNLFHLRQNNTVPNESSNSFNPQGVSIPKGVIFANDVDEGRSHLLTHQLQRPSTSSPMTITASFDARRLPNYQFDRVLCDVPCSCDGTLRKSPDVARRWRYKDSVGISVLQLAILRRGVELCKPGGIIIYSTCSLNPLENEAVVAQIIRELGDQISVVRVGSPCIEGNKNDTETIHVGEGLIARKGCKYWSSSSFLGEDKNVNATDKRKYLSPPVETDIQEQLTHCLRFHPQDNNSGGFFACVLRKECSYAMSVKSPQNNIGTPIPLITETFETMESVVKIQLEDELYTQTKNGNHLTRYLFAYAPTDVLCEIRNFYGISTLDMPDKNWVLRADQPGKVFLMTDGVIDVLCRYGYIKDGIRNNNKEPEIVENKELISLSPMQNKNKNVDDGALEEINRINEANTISESVQPLDRSHDISSSYSHGKGINIISAGMRSFEKFVYKEKRGTNDTNKENIGDRRSTVLTSQNINGNEKSIPNITANYRICQEALEILGRFISPARIYYATHEEMVTLLEKGELKSRKPDTQISIYGSCVVILNECKKSVEDGGMRTKLSETEEPMRIACVRGNDGIIKVYCKKEILNSFLLLLTMKGN